MIIGMLVTLEKSIINKNEYAAENKQQMAVYVIGYRSLHIGYQSLQEHGVSADQVKPK